MRLTATLLTATATAAATLLLTGCSAVAGVVGGDGTESYCEDLSLAQDEFSGLAGERGGPPQADDLESSITIFRELGAAAPDPVADDWQVVTDNLADREVVLDRAGLTWGDLAGASGADLPGSTTEEDLAAVGEELSALGTPELATANEAITAHAVDECGLEAPGAP